MNSEKIKIFLIHYLKKRIVPLAFLVIAITLWIIQKNELLKYKDLIPAHVEWIKLLSYLFLFLSPYLFLLKEKRYILANIVIIGPIIIVIESTCFLLLGSPDRIIKDFSLPQLPPDHIGMQLGFVPYADSIYHDRKEADGKLVFDVKYSIDKYSKRTTPAFDSSKIEYSLFFGCSIAFGYGVEDYETMAYHYQNCSNSNSYNFAYPSWATNNMLARLQYSDLSDQVKEKEGVGIYMFFWDHIKRSIGSMNRFTEWCHAFPYYYLKDGEVIRDRTFKDGRYWTSKFYELIYNTSIVQYFEIDFPISIRADHLNLIAAMIEESKNEYFNQFGNNNFFVVILPTYDKYEQADMNLLLSYLDERKVQYVDLSDFIEYSPEYHLDGDSHPNSKYNKLIAKEIHKRIKEIRK